MKVSADFYEKLKHLYATGTIDSNRYSWAKKVIRDWIGSSDGDVQATAAKELPEPSIIFSAEDGLKYVWEDDVVHVEYVMQDEDKAGTSYPVVHLFHKRTNTMAPEGPTATNFEGRLIRYRLTTVLENMHERAQLVELKDELLDRAKTVEDNEDPDAKFEHTTVKEKKCPI